MMPPPETPGTMPKPWGIPNNHASSQTQSLETKPDSQAVAWVVAGTTGLPKPGWEGHPGVSAVPGQIPTCPVALPQSEQKLTSYGAGL